MKDCSTPKREDQRVRLTKQLIQSAFLELLAQKPLQSITVKELCVQAGVNRGSFYHHYQDIYDLLAQMERTIFEDLEALLRQNTVIASPGEPGVQRAFVGAIFSFLEKNRDLCAILLGEHGDKQFVAGIIKMGREKSIREYMVLYPHITQTQAELFYSYTAWGFLGLLQHGLANPGISMETLADAADRLVAETARYFVAE